MTFEHLHSGESTGFVRQLLWVNILVFQGVLGDAVGSVDPLHTNKCLVSVLI